MVAHAGLDMSLLTDKRASLVLRHHAENVLGCKNKTTNVTAHYAKNATAALIILWMGWWGYA